MKFWEVFLCLVMSLGVACSGCGDELTVGDADAGTDSDGDGYVDSDGDWYADSDGDGYVDSDGDGGPVPPPATFDDKLVMAQFYWQYPFGLRFGAAIDECSHTPPSSPDPEAIPTVDVARLVEDPEDEEVMAQLTVYYRSQLAEAGRAGIDALAVVIYDQTVDDEFRVAQRSSLRALLRAQAELREVGVIGVPRVLLHADGIEYWDCDATSDEDWTGPGSSMDEVWEGVRRAYEAALDELGDLDPSALLRVVDERHLPLLIYHPEVHDCASGATDCVRASDYLADELAARFAEQFDQELFVVPERLLYDGHYGNNLMTVQSGNAYYFWGGAWLGMATGTPGGTGRFWPVHITTLGPGFGCGGDCQHSILRPRDLDAWRADLHRATRDGTNWVNIETLNFWSECTEIMRSEELGSVYIDAVAEALAAWRLEDEHRLFPVSGDATAEAGSVDRAVDTVETSAWNAGVSAPQSIELDLGEPRALTRIKLLVAQTPAGETRHIVEGSEERDHWHHLALIEGETTQGQWIEATLSSPSELFRWVRVRTEVSPSWVSWFEIALFGR